MEWNDARIAELTKMWQAGSSASQVARQLGGITRSAVIGKVHRLGISCRECPSRPRSPGGRPAGAARARAGGSPRKTAGRAAPPVSVRHFASVPTVTVLTLTEASCRWPIGHPDQTEFGFCGQPRTSKGPYCHGHAPLALRHKEVGMKRREIDRIVRHVEKPAPWSLLETSSEAALAAAVAVG
jgi:GcrA cell cycle regulator